MTAGRKGNSKTQLHQCPECGAELLLTDAPFRLSPARAAPRNGYGSNGQGVNEQGPDWHGERAVNRDSGFGLSDLAEPGTDQSRAQASRATAARNRATAAAERERAARDREKAASLRAEAARDRAEAMRERHLAGIDQLTGVSLRAIGLGAVEREIERSRRTGKPLVLAFVDVNNLKTVNDNEGHLAGDVLLRRVADTLRMKLRPYDVIVRFGGDEFVCALANMDVAGARRRFEDIIATLGTERRAKLISFGLAELEENDKLEHLLARADEALIEKRRSSEHRTSHA